MAKAISYRRFSSGAQATGDSLKRQTEAAQAYCDLSGDELDLSFVDAGMSAYRGRNATQGALRRLVELAEAGTFEPGTKLIVEHLDRLSRADVPTAQEQFIRILRSGLTIVTLMDRQEYDYERIKKDVGALIISIVLMYNANRESADKGERVAKAKASRRERVRAGEAKMTRQCPFWLRPKGNGEKFQFVPIPERVAVVQRIFDLALTGLGKRNITALLNREGVRPFRGGDGWHHSSVAAVLRNDRAIGFFHPSRLIGGKVVYTGEKLAGYYPRIVSEADFYRAQEAIAERRDRRAAGRKSAGFGNLFSGLGRCGQCGANLVFESRGVRKRKNGETPPRERFLVCGRALRHKDCNNDYQHRYEHIESHLLFCLQMFEKSISALLGNHQGPDAAAGKTLEDTIAGKTAEIDRLVEGFGAAPVDAVRRRIEKLDAEITAHKAELEVHHRQQRIAEANRGRNRRAEFLALIRRMGEAMPNDERYLLRARIASELRRIVALMEAEGESLVIWLGESEYVKFGVYFTGGQPTGFGFWPGTESQVQILEGMKGVAARVAADFRSTGIPTASEPRVLVNEPEGTGASVRW